MPKKSVLKKRAAEAYLTRKAGAERRAERRYQADKSAAESRKRSVTMLAKEHTGGKGPVTGPVVQRSQAKAGEAMAGAALRNVETRKRSGAYQGNVMASGGSKKQQRKLKKTMILKGTGSGASKQARAAARRLNRY